MPVAIGLTPSQGYFLFQNWNPNLEKHISVTSTPNQISVNIFVSNLSIPFLCFDWLAVQTSRDLWAPIGQLAAEVHLVMIYTGNCGNNYRRERQVLTQHLLYKYRHKVNIGNIGITEVLIPRVLIQNSREKCTLYPTPTPTPTISWGNNVRNSISLIMKEMLQINQ